MTPYEYAEHEGRLRIFESTFDATAVVSCKEDDGKSKVAHVPASEVPAAALALYEAAGLPVPLILPHPVMAGFDVAYFGNVNVGRLGAKVLVGWRGTEPQEYGPHEALELAAQIAAKANAVMRDEPDPADVESLAKAMRGAIEGYGTLPLPQANVDEVAAHAALRWMREREQ